MAASGHFLTELQSVDPTKSIAYVVNTSTYDDFEFSYAYASNVYTVTGGSDLGCEYGAGQLLYDLGFRFYAPNPEFWKKPATITTGLSKAKTAWWFLSSQMFLVYGHSWGQSRTAWRDILNDQQEKYDILVGLNTSPFPAGHRWGGIVTPNLAWFQANPQVIIGGASGLPPTLAAAAVSFDLSIGGVDYTNLVNICAAQLISEGLNAWGRTHFDPSDGDTNTSQQVFQFSKDVCTAVRVGTPAIGVHPIRAGIAGAQLGVYAYAGHRGPHTVDLEDKVYTQVALGFNNTEYTYEELVDLHGAQSAFIMLREYLSTEVWDQGYPLSAKNFANYFDRYDAFHTSGAVGVNSECGANWLANFLMLPSYVHKCRTGVTVNSEDLAEEIADDIFDSDPGVVNLLNYWSDPFVGWDKWTLRQSFNYIDTMVDSWYKTYFEQVVTIWRADMYLPAKTPANDTYRTAVTQMLRWTTGVAISDILHSYAKIRQRANTALNDYPDIKWNTTPEPDWHANPVAPTHSDYLAARTLIHAETVRDEDLDDTDYVLVTGITPRSGVAAAATKFFTIGRATYKFIGPGAVVVQEVSESGLVMIGSPSATDYGSGMHTISLSGNYMVSNSGGYLFLDSFPKVRKDPDATGRRHYVYIPTRAQGIVRASAKARVRFIDQNGVFNLYPMTSASYVDPANLGTGQVAIDNVNTRDYFYNDGMNRYISMRGDIALIPRPIADEDFPTRVKINVVP